MIWLLLGGRGCGKTRTGAEWIKDQVQNTGRIALVAPTFHDAREVMLEGESGLLNIGLPMERPMYISSRRRLEWPNGAVGNLFSAEDPESLRGPQFGAAWADEFCSWAYPEEALSNLRLCLRLGENPRLVVTTTPKPLPSLGKLMAAEKVLISRATTADNAGNLSPQFVSAMDQVYGGTRLGRQELNGEVLSERYGALWSQDAFECCRYADTLPGFNKIIIAIDPPVTSGVRSDQCGIIVAGRQGEGRTARAFILHDGTVQGVSPEGWVNHAIDLYQGWQADGLVVEVNQGGDLVSTLIEMVDPYVPVTPVFAKKSKAARAEPVANLYAQGRVFHAGRFDALESELLTIGTSDSRKSPDRADALVWAVAHLLLQDSMPPSIRMI